MTIDHYFSEELADIYEGGASQQDFFQRAFHKLKNQGYVDTSFLEALLLREKEYPTGLKTPFGGVAIPHTDPTHIKKPFIYLTKLKHPLQFGQMGSVDEQVDASYVFILGFEKGEEQLILLKNLMAMFSDQHTMACLSEANSEQEMYHIITQYYNNQG